MSATLEAPIAAQDTPLLPDDEKKTLSSELSSPARLQLRDRPRRRFYSQLLAPRSVPRAPLDQLPLAATVQPALSSFDRVARDFPDLFVLASSC